MSWRRKARHPGWRPTDDASEGDRRAIPSDRESLAGTPAIVLRVVDDLRVRGPILGGDVGSAEVTWGIDAAFVAPLGGGEERAIELGTVDDVRLMHRRGSAFVLGEDGRAARVATAADVILARRGR